MKLSDCKFEEAKPATEMSGRVYFCLEDLMIGSASEHLLQVVQHDKFTGSQASMNMDLASKDRQKDK